MTADIAFFMLVCAVLFGGVYGWRHYLTPLNPLTFTSFIWVGLFTLTSGLIAYGTVEIAPFTPDALTKTALISLAGHIGFILPYFFKRAFLLGYYGRLINCIGLGSSQMGRQFSLSKFILLLTGSIISFVALAMMGGGGLLWITDTRTAYIQNRAGAGQFFASMQWFLVFAVLYYLWSRHPRGLHLILLLVFFGVLAYFSGSKNNILNFGVIGIFYYNYCINYISLKWYGIIIPLFITAFASLLVIQGAAISIFVYFNEYFSTTAWFLSRFDEFYLHYGTAMFSELWFYVPRGLYPDKPYEYGVTLIHQVLFPLAAETGNTPGVLPWAIRYLDFGVAGVFVDGFIRGACQRTVYDYFLSSRQNFFSFFFAMQFSLWPVLIFAPPIITIMLALIISIYFRLVLGRRLCSDIRTKLA